MAELIGGAVAEKVAEKLIDRILNFILSPISVVRKCNENVQNLKNQIEELENTISSVEGSREYVRRRGEDIGEGVQTWLTKADEFIKVARAIGVGDEFAKNECFFRLCPNPRPRYELSEKAAQFTGDIAKHVQEARGFHLPFSHVPPPQQDVAAVVEGFEEFSSRMAVLEQIMEALNAPTVNTIGVHGTSGVGKTMLVKMVKGKAMQGSLFAAVVMAKVTKSPDLKSIQEDIARDLGFDQLSFRKRTDRQVADLIKAKLMKERKFLVILDDVWDTEIDFEQFGIPSASEMKQAMEKENEEGSSRQQDMLRKILLTSRDPNVLSGMMEEKDLVFKVHELEDDEAWLLFKKIVGSKVESSDFQPIAKEIVEKCLGLPVAIASVGKAMKGKTRQHEWTTALMELKSPTPEGISAAVYKPIELSYKYLQGDELKQTFMLCSLLGHDSSINDLLKYGMGLTLFRKAKTVEETRDKVLTLVHSLKISSLLVDGHSNMHFGMHDQIREVALSIASREHGVLALVDEDGGKDWPEKETMENLKWIYLSNGYPELTSNGLNCPQLTFFHLSNKGCSLAVPTDLLTGTDVLKVLCLTRIDFQSMPSEIPLIPTMLRTLLLDQCVFRVEALGASVGNLENLEVLSLAGCDIEELPREMEKLTKLKLLDLSDCTKLKVIPRQVLARLSKLEELKMGNSFDQWDDVEGRNAGLAELTELHMLTALEVRIPNFREILFPENLKRFKIFIGIASGRKSWKDYYWESYSWNSSFESSKVMKLKLQGASIESNDSVKKLLKKTEELYLEGVQGLVDELDDEGFQHLKCLHVQNAPDIRGIFNPARRLLHSQVFPMLEVLTLSNLQKMEKICHGLTGAAPFKVLSKITVFRCHQLKNLFSFSMARQLQLQEITVQTCDNIAEIIDDVEEQGNGNDIVEESEGCKLGNNLRSLTLNYLPKLNSFFNGGNCSGFSLFNDKVVFSNLVELELSGIKINQLWITSSYTVTSQEILNFKKLKRLQISDCSSLEYVFTPSMVSGLGHLENLVVSSCDDLKQVIMVKGVEEVVNTELIFPRLNSIGLHWCGKLSSFYAGSSALKFQSAIKIKIYRCPNMITFASTFSIEQEKETAYRGTEGHLEKKELDIRNQIIFFDTVVFSNLEELNLLEIKINQLWITSSYTVTSQEILNFKKLKRLKISYCSSLEYLFTPSMVSGLGHLENLVVSSCQDLKQVIMVKGVEEVVNTELIFPRLNSITLFCCDKLSSFYAGSSALKFQLAIKIEIYNCPNMITFAFTFSTEQEKETAYRETEGHLGKKELDIRSRTIFFDTVVFSNLEELNLFEIKINQLWITSSYTVTSQEILNFRKLKRLQISDCSSLEYLFTPSMVSSLGHLENLDVSSCQDLKQVIMVKGVEEVVNTELIFPRLNSIKLRWCGKLSSFYAGSSALKFQLAIKITIYGCPNMITFASTFSTEQEKETSYRGTEGHLGKKESDIRSQTTFFDTVKTFASEFPSIEITDGDNQLERQTQDPMFWIGKDSFSCLEELKFQQNDNMKEIWRGQYPGAYFPKLKDFKLLQFQICSALLRSFNFFFQTLPSLEKLNVSEASFHEIFQCVRLRSEGRTTDAPPRLRKLKLSKLNGLMHLWKEESDLKLIFYNLRSLKVLECIKLVNLVPSVVSFVNLQTLEISKCHGLENLVSYSTAKSLEQLERMSITDCDLVEEIVKCLEDNVKDGIVFSQLKSLQLRGLPKLSSFCTRRCDFEFPSLKEAIVIGCPQMKCFSMGKTITKELQNVQWTNDEEKRHWAGDLDSTIQDLFTQ
ncbi:hypothetical protein SLE2022_141610 [Rubroshorea leprosula]